MSKSLILLGFARENSTRVEKKLIKPFGDTTLYDICIDKFIQMQERDNPFSKILMAISPLDKIIWNKTINSGIEIAPRNRYSINAPPNFDIRKAYHFLEDYDDDYIMWLNPCFPFLKVDTILEIGNYFIDNDIDGLDCIVKRQNWFWDDKKKPINIEEGVVSTQGMKPIYESVQFTHIFNRKYLLDNNRMFPYIKDNPYLYEIPDSPEFMDIDTPEEFKLAEYMWRAHIL